MNKRREVRLILILLAIALIIWGIARKEHKATQTNAQYLCLDCIGIGQ